LCAGVPAAAMIDHSEKHRLPTRKTRRNRSHFAARTRKNFLSFGIQGRILNFGQVYLETSKDKDGNWLDGGKTYRMRVPANPPVVQFWSFTLYDNTTVRFPRARRRPGASGVELAKPSVGS
jgi:hypothetical protein